MTCADRTDLSKEDRKLLDNFHALNDCAQKVIKEIITIFSEMGATKRSGWLIGQPPPPDPPTRYDNRVIDKGRVVC